MRRKDKRFKKLIGYSMTMGGAGLIGATMPGTSGAPVTQVATSGAPFVAPMSAAVGAGKVMETLKDLKPKKRKRRRR